MDVNDASLGYTHLGADQRPLLVVMIVSAAGEGLVMLFGIMVMIWLKNHTSGNMLHHTVKILFVSNCFTFVGSVCYAIHLGVLSGDGVGVTVLKYIGYCCYAIATAVLLVEIIVITKGWTIVRRKISAGGRMIIAACVTTFLIIYLTCIFWALLNQDVAEYVTIYETPPGSVLIALRFVAFIWFITVRVSRCVCMRVCVGQGRAAGQGTVCVPPGVFGQVRVERVHVLRRACACCA